MRDLKDQLIRLGYTNPELRDNLRPILATLDGRSVLAKKVEEELVDLIVKLTGVEFKSARDRGNYIRDLQDLSYLPDVMQEGIEKGDIAHGKDSGDWEYGADDYPPYEYDLQFIVTWQRLAKEVLDTLTMYVPNRLQIDPLAKKLAVMPIFQKALPRVVKKLPTTGFPVRSILDFLDMMPVMVAAPFYLDVDTVDEFDEMDSLRTSWTSKGLLVHEKGRVYPEYDAAGDEAARWGE